MRKEFHREMVCELSYKDDFASQKRPKKPLILLVTEGSKVIPGGGPGCE